MTAQLAECADTPPIAANLRDAFPSPYTLADAEWHIRDGMARDGQDALFRAILVDSQAVGSISVCQGSDVYRRSGELGYFLAEPYWGKGYMSWAVRLMCQTAFRELDIVRIYAQVFAHNTASCRVLEKCGFTLEGTLRQSIYKRGRMQNSRIYALLKREGNL